MPPPICPPLKSEAPQPEKQPPLRIVKRTPLPGNDFKKKKSETVIKTSLIKQHWKKMAEIPQKGDFLTWSIQNVVSKVKQFVRKYCIT